MAVISQEAHRFSNVVKQELWSDFGYCREVVTANEATAKQYPVGTVLGRVTATGKYVISVQTAVDGSEIPAAIVIQPYSIPATTDVKVITLVRGPAAINKAGLVLDASFNTPAELAAVYAAFEAKGIQVLDAV